MMRSLSGVLTAALLSVSGAPGHAQEADAAPDALIEALRLPEMLEVMREEGIAYGEDIGIDLFDGGGNPEWSEIVSTIYDLDRMQSVVYAGLGVELDGADVGAMVAFFNSEPGRTIVSLEVSARRALLDDAVEEASKEAAAIAMMDETDRFQLVRRYVEANDLIETNVVGAMNSNYAFYTGLLDGGAFPGDLTEEQILTDVWSQEPEIRSNTTEWVYSYLMLAYQPLSDGDLETYIAFSQSDAGQALNAALFAAFDDLFEGISRELGLASSQYMAGQDI